MAPPPRRRLPRRRPWGRRRGDDRPRRSRRAASRVARSSAGSSSACSRTSSRSSPSTPRTPPRRSIARASKTRSCSPASTTPSSAAARARTSSSIPSGSRGSAPACRTTRRRCARRSCTTPSRTPRRRSRKSGARFGDEIAAIVDGVTKLTGHHVPVARRGAGRELPQDDGRDGQRLAGHPDQARRPPAQHAHDRALPKQKQMEKARETLEIYAPIAHRLGIHAIKWELEDLSFATLHPRKYQEIKELVAQQREERERYVSEAGAYLATRARRARHQGRDRRPREALLLDLREDDQEEPRVQRDLRPHGDARDRRLREGLLRRRRA